jgi:lipopolysaccharide export system permease protein
MKKLDKYIIGKYIGTFLFTVLIFSLITLIVDFTEKVEEFIKKPCTVNEIIFDYYATFLIYINAILLPLYALVAVIFFTSRLASNSEIISVLNAGVSFRRLMLPYLLAGGAIAGFHFMANHYLVPNGNKTRIDFENKYIVTDHNRTIDKNIHMFITPKDKIYVRFYHAKDTTMRDIRLEHFENNQLTSLTKATNAKFLGYPDKWEIKNYEMRTFDGMDETMIKGKGKTIDTTFNLRPEDFVRFHNQKEMMTTPELKEFIQGEIDRGLGNTKIYDIEIYRRTSEPISILILTIIGMAVAARKVRGGMGLHLAMGIGIGAIFIFLSRFTQTFAMSDAITPILGVWLPNIIFGSIAIYLVSKAQK